VLAGVSLGWPPAVPVDLGLDDRGDTRFMKGRLGSPATIKVFTIGALLLFAAFLVFGAYTVARITERIYLERLRAGEMVAATLARAARVPLLGDDTLSLHGLLEGSSRAEGVIYALILDAGKRVKAKADSPQVANPQDIPGFLESVGGAERDSPVTDVVPSGARVLRFSRPVTFANKIVGYVVLGLSKEAIDDGVRAESRFLWTAFGILGACASALLAGGLILLWGRGNPAAGSKGSSFAPGRVVQGLPESSLDRTHVTVLFAGVKGFKIYADTREPGQVMLDMSGYHALATETITQFGGEVDKFVGDAVIGVFQRTVLSPDHIERAVRSAAALQESLRRAAGDGNPLYSLIGIGISSGVALAGRLDTKECREPLYIGESFKSAYLLHAMSAPGEIVISRDVFQVVEGAVLVEPLPPREMMERTEPWENFRLLQVRDDGKSDA
jgi:class 3 adenylate cyclase